jgi:hypothetical protein
VGDSSRPVGSAFGCLIRFDDKQNTYDNHQKPMANEAEPNEGGWQFSAFKMLAFYFVISQVVKQGKPPPAKGSVSPGTASEPKTFRNAWARQQKFDIHVYVSTSDTFDVFDEAALVWRESSLVYAIDDARSTRQAF